MWADTEDVMTRSAGAAPTVWTRRCGTVWLVASVGLGGCHPDIFAYDVELMVVTDVPSAAVDSNAEPGRTETSLNFGALDIPGCVGNEAPLDAIDTITLTSWEVGGIFGGPLSGVQYSHNPVVPGMVLADDLSLSVALGGCDTGERVGAGVVPAGTEVGEIPAAFETGDPNYRPQGAEVLLSWSGEEAAPAFQAAVLAGNDLAAGSWAFDVDATACHSDARHEDAPGSGSSEASSGSLLMVHVARFVVEGQGHPCSAASEEGA